MTTSCETPNTNIAFYYQWKVWHLMGIKAPKAAEKHLRFYRIYAILINTIVTFLFPLTLIINVFYAQNMQQLCENLTISMSDTIANLKFLNVYLVRHELAKIKEILRQLDERAQNAEQRKELNTAITTSQTIFLVFLRIFTVGTCLSVLRVILADKRSILFPAWFGVNWLDNGGIYSIVITYQLFGLIVQALQNVASDSYPPAYLVILTAHMKALELRVTAIGRNSRNYTEKLSLTEEEKRKHLNEFNECIKDYKNILNFIAVIIAIMLHTTLIVSSVVKSISLFITLATF